MPKKVRCTVDWRSIRDLNSGGATNALSHFECDPFDLLGNAPYSNPPKSSLEKGEKSRREQQIFNCRKRCVFDDGSLENKWQLPKCLLDFECLLLRPLEYCSLYNLQNPLRKRREFMERIANEKIKFPPDFNATTSSFAKGFQKPVMFSSATSSTS